MSAELSVALDQRRGSQGCQGRNGKCPDPVEYVAVLDYCECIERSDGLAAHDPASECSYSDRNEVALCRRCAGQIRLEKWPCLTAVRDT